MLRAIGWITREHDPSLVALAFVACLLSIQAGTRLVAPGRDREFSFQQAPFRLAAAFITFGAGFWTTMFSAVAAFRPDLQGGFDIAFLLLSMLLAALPAAVLLAVSLTPGPNWLALACGGLLFGAGLLGIHVLSMRTLLADRVAPEHAATLLAVLLAGSTLATLGLGCLGGVRHVLAKVLLATSAMLVHLGAIPGMALQPLPEEVSLWQLPAWLGGLSTLLVVILWFGAAQLDRRAAERSASDAARLRRHAEAGFEGLIFEHGGIITDANGAMLQLSGCDRHQLIGAHVAEIIRDYALRSAPGQPSEHDLQQSDGTTRPVEVLWRNGADAGGHVLAIRDLTREKSALAQLQRLASYDPLTGLPNRDHFEKTLTQMLAIEGGGRPLALIYVDLDRFESIVENFGGRASDQSLVQVARRLGTVAPGAAMIARLGHDEFAILHPHVDSGVNAQALAAQLIQDLSRPIDADGQVVALTASAGVALYPDHGATAEALLRNAATALRRAKREGRCTWRMFEAEFGRRLHEQQALEADLAAALATGQLTLHYQTFFDAETLEPAGAEALLRWTHPLRGRIPPAEFIPLAEANGLIVPMGKWVLRTACAEAAGWDRPVTIAVNVSPAQFAEASIVGDVASVLAQTGLPPERLELEITETALMQDTGNALRMLRDLKAMGVGIAMDDFGTGHSSLGNLRKFPFDKIKIDRSFISDGDDEPGAEAIVQTVIAMGNSLGLTITAEGVETPRQLAMLRSLGCTYVQGYLLARPCPSEQLRLMDDRAGWLSSGGAAPVTAAGMPRRLAVADTR